MRGQVGRTARLIGASALAGGLLVATVAAPASAHDRVDDHGKIAVNPSGDVGAVPTISGSFTGTEVVGIKSENINSVSITLTPTAPTGGSAVTVNGCDFATEGKCGSPDITFSWTPAAPPFNGPYEANATASHCTIVCVTPSTARVTAVGFRLGIAPRAPSDVQVTNGPERSVNVSWTRNPEPDMLYYAVFRKAPGAADFTRVGGDIRQPASGRVSYSDTATADGGVFAYKVLAVRKGVTGDDKTTKTSGPSAERSATVEAPIPTTVSPAVPGGPAAAPAQPAQAVPAGAGVSISGFLGSQPSAKPLPGPKFLDLPDTGFGNTLPFGTPPPDELEEGELEAVVPESAASDDTSSVDDVSLARPLVPVAAGAILLVLAAHIRLLNRKLKEVPVGASAAAVAVDGDEVEDAASMDTEVVAASPYAPSFEEHLKDSHYDYDEESDQSQWVDYEPPAMLDSSAGGGSLLAPESIGRYTEAAAPYYEGAGVLDPLSAMASAGFGRASTAVWRGPGLDGAFSAEEDFVDGGSAAGDEPFDHDSVAIDAEDPLAAPMFPDDAVDAVHDAAPADDAAHVTPAASEPAAADDSDLWEEEMIWEVVSPSR